MTTMASQPIHLFAGRRAIAAVRCLHTSASAVPHQLTAAVQVDRYSAVAPCVPGAVRFAKVSNHAVRYFSSSTSETSGSDQQADAVSQDGSGASTDDGETRNTQHADQGAEWKRKLLDRALQYVPMHGWHLACVEKAAEELELSPSVVGMLENGAADLVLHFERQCNERLVESIRDWKAQMEEQNERVGATKIIRESVRQRLAMIGPHLASWPEALALFSQPSVAPQAIELLLHLVDDIWHLAGDESTDFSWYTKRATLAAVYGSTELFLLQDKSAGNEETWQFLDRRLADVGQIGSLQATMKQALCTAVELGCVSLHTAQKLSRTVPPVGSDMWTRIFPSGPR